MKYCVIWRCPNASYNVSSMTCGWMPKRAAASRSMVRVAVVPPICWSVARSRNTDTSRSFARTFGAKSYSSPASASCKVYWYCVLEIRPPTRMSCAA